MTLLNQTEINKHRILTASDASKSEVTGLDLTQVSQGNTINITVTAKDSSGNSIASGGEKFIVKISNACTKYNQYYCAPSGSTKPLSSNINDVMTDHNNGTYTYSYPVPNTRKNCLNLNYSWLNFSADLLADSRKSLS